VFGIDLKEVRWQRRLLLWAGVVALLFAYPPFLIFPLAWLAPLFLFFCLALTSVRRSFRYGYFFGFLFNFFSLYWISYVTGGGWIFACFFQALYWALFALGTRFLMAPLFASERLRYRFLFAVGTAGLWTVLEAVRVNLPGFGFGWNLLSYSQAFFLPFIQIAEWIGAYGISFVMIFSAALFFAGRWDIYRGVKHRWLHALLYLALFLALFLGILVHGIFSLKTTRMTDRSLQVGVIQGNIPQEIKWNVEVKDKIIEKYVKLSQLLLYDHPDMILWPEAAYPGYLETDLTSSGIADLVQHSKIPYLIGSPRYEGANIYNSALWLSPEGKIEAFYDKRELVPFGEYIPLKRLLFFLEKLAYSFGVGDFSPGGSWQVFRGPLDTKFAALICFENVFPSMTSEFTKRGAEFFVVITNDSWFQRSRAPYEHLYTSVFRAIETRRPFIHAANTGLSGFIDADGRVVDTLRDKNEKELFVTGGMSRSVYPQQGLTFYVRYGGLIPWIAACLAFLSLVLVTFLNRKNKNRP